MLAVCGAALAAPAPSAHAAAAPPPGRGMHAFVADLATGALRQLAQDRRDIATEPRLAWAPDGGGLLLTDDRRVGSDRFTRTLVRYPADGGAPADVAPVDCAATQVIVSPAGDRLAEVARSPFMLPISSGHFRKPPDTFVLRTLDGRVLARLRGSVAPWEVAWSADGSRVAVPVGDSHLRRWRIRVLDAATGAPLGTVRSPELPDLAEQAFSPDGTRIAFATMDRLAFRIGDVRTGAVRRLGRPAPVRGRRRGRPRLRQDELVDEVAWSPAGDRLAVLMHDGRVRLAGVDGTFGPPVAPPGRGRPNPPALLSWSPDGTRLAWWASRFDRHENEQTSIVVLDAATRGVRTLGRPRHGLAGDLRWSPDSTRLAFLFEDRPAWE